MLYDLELQCWQLHLIPIAFCIDEILLCEGDEYSIPILTSLPSREFKKAAYIGPVG